EGGSGMSEDLCFMPATEMAARIRRRALSPVEAVEAFLTRIGTRNSAINAYVTVIADQARAAARAAERAVMSGAPLGPLHGRRVVRRQRRRRGRRPRGPGAGDRWRRLDPYSGLLLRRLWLQGLLRPRRLRGASQRLPGPYALRSQRAAHPDGGRRGLDAPHHDRTRPARPPQPAGRRL